MTEMRTSYENRYGALRLVPEPLAVRRDFRDAIAPVETILDEARNGRMFILVDDEDRENEGDLIIPAQMATPDAINFMAKYGRGLICLALTQERVDQLGLPPMSRSNGTRHETAFTVSIEAREGVTTGISAADRARTIAVASDACHGAADLVSPGHIFPLRARPGGVLERAGHTEAAVDVARLAGLMPAGVICEIMNEDGTMARLPQLVSFAAAHGLKLGTIRDLIDFRCRHDPRIERVSASGFSSRFGGHWRMLRYRDVGTGKEIDVLLLGAPLIDAAAPVHFRAPDRLTDLLGKAPRPTEARLQDLMRSVADAGTGIIILDHEDAMLRKQILGDLGMVGQADRECRPRREMSS